MTYQLSLLGNGVRVASENLPGAHSTAFAIAFDVGSRHEEANEHGLSHLLEHMAFKGTSRMNARAIAEAFDLMGGNVNAYTSHEHTVYYAKVLKEYAADALRLLCEILSDAVFDQVEIEREREVILQEIAMHCDTPDQLVFDLFQDTVYKGQALGHSILGSTESVSNFTRDDLLRYTQRHYGPKRLVIAAAGAVEHQMVEDIGKEFFGSSKSMDGERPLSSSSYLSGEHLMEKALEQVQLVVGFPGLPVDDSHYYAIQIFSTILGGGISSRLFQEIRETRGLAYSVSSFTTSYQDTGVLGIYAGTTQEHLGELMGGLRQVLEQVRRGVTSPEMLRAKNQIKASIVMTRESSGAIAEWIARHLHIYGRYRTAGELVAAIDAVTPEDIAAVAERCLNARPAVVALGPGVASASLTEKLAA